MKRLLRGIIDFEDGRASLESLNSNMTRLLRATGIEWNPVDARIYAVVRDLHSTTFEPPSEALIRDFFDRQGDTEALDRLRDVATATLFQRENYSILIRDLLEAQSASKLQLILKRAGDIAAKGLILEDEVTKKKRRLQGSRDAIFYLQQNTISLVHASDSNYQNRGDVIQDVEAGLRELQITKANKGKMVGVYSGIEKIDTAFPGGLKRGELWTHAAFTGELKTTLALNIAYNNVTKYRTNVFYVTAEQTYSQLRRQLYALHTANPKWGRPPLSYSAIRDADLSSEEERLYAEMLADLKSNPEHCKLEVWATQDVSIQDIALEAELYHRKHEIGLIVIDHGGIIKSSIHHRDYVIEANQVLRDAKKLALGFNGHEGVPVIILFQINRQGKDDADKSNGVYKIKALTYANEAEKSSDRITTTYLNEEHRKAGTTKICCLKSRDDGWFDPFLASCHLKSRRIFDFDERFSTASGISAQEGDALLAMV